MEAGARPRAHSANSTDLFSWGRNNHESYAERKAPARSRSVADRFSLVTEKGHPWAYLGFRTPLEPYSPLARPITQALGPPEVLPGSRKIRFSTGTLSDALLVHRQCASEPHKSG